MKDKIKKKNCYLGIAELKSILKQYNKDDLMQLFIECYKANPQLKEYITAKFADEDTVEQILEIYKRKIRFSLFSSIPSGQLDLRVSKKVISDFKRLCKDEKMIIDLMMYFVEVGIDFTNAYGDISESFYSSIENMYRDSIELLNKSKNRELYNLFINRMRVAVDSTCGIGWGFHDALGYMYKDIKWLDIEDIDKDKTIKLKEYIINRLKRRSALPEFAGEISLEEGTISKIIEADEVFLNKMDKQRKDYSNDEETEYISEKTDLEGQLVEFILWQKYCFEMENDYWQYGGTCKKCGSDKLYFKETPNEDFVERIVCKVCGMEYELD